MKAVVVESPFAGQGNNPVVKDINQALNEEYLSACLHDCVVNQEESPYASHRILTGVGVLDDNDPVERTMGIQAGFEFRGRTDASVFYADRGFSSGMLWGLKDALLKMHPIEFRSIGFNGVKVMSPGALHRLERAAILEVCEKHKDEFDHRQRHDADFCSYILRLTN